MGDLTLICPCCGKAERDPDLGRKAGLARAASLTPERRKEIAVKAATARWAPTRTAARPPREGE
jgi:hypothetical protein